MDFDLEKVRENVQGATTRDLLNRVTVYRSGMEPDAVVLIEKELESRGVASDYVDKYAQEMRDRVILHDDGTAAKCTKCYEPAIAQGMGWHYLFGKVPIFPRWYYYCEEHQPAVDDSENPEQHEEDSDQVERKFMKDSENEQ